MILISGNLSKDEKSIFLTNFEENTKLVKVSTGKFLSEELILASTNRQYDKRLFIKLRVQYMKTSSSEHVAYKNWFLF